MDLDVNNLIKSFGYMGVWAIIFAETGILFGVLLPGDSLLIAAGIFAARGHFDITIMTIGCFAAALVGNMFGYEMGRRFGKPFLEKYGPELTTPEKIAKTYEIMRRHQQVGIIVSRFFPVARTFAPFLGGVVHIKYIAFIIYSVLGALLWGAGLPLFGYYLGGILPDTMTDWLILPIIALLLVTILLPYAKKRFWK